MWKRFSTLILCLVMSLTLLTACSGSVSNEAAGTATESQSSAQPAAATASDAPEQQTSETFNIDNINTRNLVFWDRMGTEHIMGRTDQAFADALYELSEGKITSTMYLSGEIEVSGTVAEQFELIDAARYQLENSASYGFEEGCVFGLPYLFESREHFWKFAESDLGQKVVDDVNAGHYGVHAFGYIEEGARDYFTTSAHPISTYKDLAGLKLRVQATDMYVGMAEAIGASATQMAWSEVYSSLSNGVVDGAENPLSGYNSYMLYEVAPYFYEDEHIWGADLLVIAERVWDELNDDEKALFEQAAAEAIAFNKENIASDEEEIEKEIEEKGVTVIKPTAEEKAELYKLCYPMYETYAGDYLDLVEQIRELG